MKVNITSHLTDGNAGSEENTSKDRFKAIQPRKKNSVESGWQ